MADPWCRSDPALREHDRAQRLLRDTDAHHLLVCRADEGQPVRGNPGAVPPPPRWIPPPWPACCWRSRMTAGRRGHDHHPARIAAPCPAATGHRQSPYPVSLVQEAEEQGRVSPALIQRLTVSACMPPPSRCLACLSAPANAVKLFWLVRGWPLQSSSRPDLPPRWSRPWWLPWRP